MNKVYPIAVCAVLGVILAGCADITQEYKPLYQVEPEKEMMEEPIDYSAPPVKKQQETNTPKSTGKGA